MSNLKHGHKKRKQTSREYHSWEGAKTRCTNPNATGYQRYGGKGVKFCARWSGKDGFINFLADMGPRPEGYSLDRIDPNGDYAPENTRWVDATAQARGFLLDIRYEMFGSLYVTPIEERRMEGARCVPVMYSFVACLCGNNRFIRKSELTIGRAKRRPQSCGKSCKYNSHSTFGKAWQANREAHLNTRLQERRTA